MATILLITVIMITMIIRITTITSEVSNSRPYIWLCYAFFNSKNLSNVYIVFQPPNAVSSINSFIIRHQNVYFLVFNTLLIPYIIRQLVHLILVQKNSYCKLYSSACSFHSAFIGMFLSYRIRQNSNFVPYSSACSFHFCILRQIHFMYSSAF